MGLLLFGLAANLALVLVARLDVRHALRDGCPSGPEHRTARGAALGLLAGLCLAPLGLVWAVAPVGGVPVAPPARPWAGPTGELLEIGAATLFGIALFLIALRLLPSAIGFLAGRRASADRLGIPSGRRTLRAALAFGTIVALAAVVRFAVGGYDPTTLRTYGALTPDGGAEGWQVERVLRRVLPDRSALQPLAEGPPLESELSYHECGDSCAMLGGSSGYVSESGLKAWVAGSPALIQLQGGIPVLRPVARRDPADVPHERRPHFSTMPTWAGMPKDPGELDRYVLVEERPDGRVFAVVMNAADADGASLSTLGALLQAPFWPWFVLVVALFAAGWIARRVTQDTPRAGPIRIAAAWVVLETAVLALALYSRYL
jgi:hypothetical protein